MAKHVHTHGEAADASALPVSAVQPQPAQSIIRGATTEAGQVIPVNLLETPEGLEIVAPLPGLEPEDIYISVANDELTIQGKMRGPGQERRDYLVHEWHYGPYIRNVSLPFPVDAQQARVTYGNGILTVAMPRARVTRAHSITLTKVSQFRGRSPADLPEG